MKIVLIVALTGTLLSVIAPPEIKNTSRDGLITTVSGLDKILDQSEIYEQKRLSAREFDTCKIQFLMQKVL